MGTEVTMQHIKELIKKNMEELQKKRILTGNNKKEPQEQLNNPENRKRAHNSLSVSN